MGGKHGFLPFCDFNFLFCIKACGRQYAAARSIFSRPTASSCTSSSPLKTSDYSGMAVVWREEKEKVFFFEHGGRFQ